MNKVETNPHLLSAYQHNNTLLPNQLTCKQGFLVLPRICVYRTSSEHCAEVLALKELTLSTLRPAQVQAVCPPSLGTFRCTAQKKWGPQSSVQNTHYFRQFLPKFCIKASIIPGHNCHLLQQALFHLPAGVCTVLACSLCHRKL